MADFMLHGFALGASAWAFFHTGSLFLSLWCFFLAQALFVLIPARIGKKQAATSINDSNNDVNFQRAYREAEAAVRKLSTH